MRPRSFGLSSAYCFHPVPESQRALFLRPSPGHSRFSRSEAIEYASADQRVHHLVFGSIVCQDVLREVNHLRLPISEAQMKLPPNCCSRSTDCSGRHLLAQASHRRVNPLAHLFVVLEHSASLSGRAAAPPRPDASARLLGRFRPARPHRGEEPAKLPRASVCQAETWGQGRRAVLGPAGLPADRPPGDAWGPPESRQPWRPAARKPLRGKPGSWPALPYHGESPSGSALSRLAEDYW
jgi:hypothetical protein